MIIMKIASYVSLIILSLTIFLIGAFIKNIAIILLGGVIGLSIPLYLQYKTEREESEKLPNPSENKYEPVISSELKWRWKQKYDKKKK
jgi:hypothetical protein